MLANNTINLSVIYRPPDKSVLSLADDFPNYMESIINSAGKNLLFGNFNIHVKDQSNSDTRNFQDLLDSFRLINHISFDTHCLENTIDLVIISARDNFIRNPYQGCLSSDHNIVFFDIISNRAKEVQWVVSLRNSKTSICMHFAMTSPHTSLGLILHSFHQMHIWIFTTPCYHPDWIYMLPWRPKGYQTIRKSPGLATSVWCNQMEKKGRAHMAGWPK